MKLINDKLLDYLENIKYYVATICKYEDNIEVVGIFRKRKDADKALLIKLSNYGLLYHYSDNENEEDIDIYPIDIDFINKIDFEKFTLASFVELNGDSYYGISWNCSIEEVKPS
tara:strand:- start:852 stop:1193 length:342 start_codon:yes stop_codon:yes gene_type:complete